MCYYRNAWRQQMSKKKQPYKNVTAHGKMSSRYSLELYNLRDDDDSEMDTTSHHLGILFYFMASIMHVCMKICIANSLLHREKMWEM